MKKILQALMGIAFVCSPHILNAAACPELTNEMIKNGKLDAINELLDAGADPNKIVSGTRYTPLMCAALDNKPDIALALLKKGARINDQSEEDFNTTAIMIAAGAGHTDMVRLLIDHGADLTIVSELEETAIRKAAWRERKWDEQHCLEFIMSVQYTQEQRPVIRTVLILAQGSSTSNASALTLLRRLPHRMLKNIFATLLCTSQDNIETAMQNNRVHIMPPEDWIISKIGDTYYAEYMRWRAEEERAKWQKQYCEEMEKLQAQNPN